VATHSHTPLPVTPKPDLQPRHDHYYKAETVFGASIIHVWAWKREGQVFAFIPAGEPDQLREFEIKLICEIRYTQYYHHAKKKAKERLKPRDMPAATTIAEAKLRGTFYQRTRFRTYVLKDGKRVLSRVKIYPSGYWRVKAIICKCGKKQDGLTYQYSPAELTGISIKCTCGESLI